RTDNIAEQCVVFAAFQPVPSAGLLICPSRRQILGRSEVIIDNRALAKRWSDDVIATFDQRLEQLFQMLSFDNDAVSNLQRTHGSKYSCEHHFSPTGYRNVLVTVGDVGH